MCSPTTGASLKPWPEPPPASQRFSAPRMAVEDEVAVRGVLVLADAGLDERRAGHRGEAAGEDGAGLRQALRRREALVRRRVDLRAAGVVRHLEAAVAVARDAVEDPLAEVDPERAAVLVEAPVARRRAEEEDLLAGGAESRPHEVGEQPAEPWAAGEDVGVGREAAAVGERQVGHQAAGDRPRLDAELAHLAACRRHRPRHHLAGPPCPQVAGSLLDEDRRDAVEIDLRKALAALGD